MLRKAFVLFLLFLGYMTNASVANLDSRRLPVSSSFQSLEDTLDGVDYIFCINFGGSQSTLHLLDQKETSFLYKKKMEILWKQVFTQGEQI